MLRFLLGVFAGALAIAGGAFFWTQRDACFGRCGDGTRCRDHVCVALVASNDAPTAPARVTRPKRRRGEPGLAPAQAEATLKPGDEQMIAQGDALGRPEHVDLTEAGPDGKELSQDDLDAVFHKANATITRCITTALGDAPLETGRVEVGFRIEKGGEVSRVRVEAPALLQRNGLSRCVRSAVVALHFPASGGANVVTYPFELK